MSEVAHQVIKAEPAAGRRSLVEKFSTKYSIEPTRLMGILKSTAFRLKGGGEVSNEQMAALLVVADQYGLNPFTKELYAFPQEGGIVPIVGIDGWARIINERPELDGIEFEDVGKTNTIGKAQKSSPEGITCIIHRKDRDHPTKVTEWITECYRDTKPWNEMPRRMLRHKALVQCARIAFGFVGIYDEDEGARIIEGDVVIVNTDGTPFTGGTASAVNDALRPKADIVDAEVVDTKADTKPEPAPETNAETTAQPDTNADMEAATASPALELEQPAEDSTTNLLQLIMDAQTDDDLDYVRGLNSERKATASSKAQVSKAITNKAAALKDQPAA